METSIKAVIDNWLNDPAIDETNKREIRDLVASGSEKELTDRFYRELEFGTGGMRGIIGAGINRMNIYTVGAAAQGLANYIAKQGKAAKEAGVAIAYDCRRKSDVFADRVASVLAGNGIRVYLFDEPRPTPQLSFAVRYLGCTAGVVITASHNPPIYNGFKAYWSDGAGVVPPHDQNIIKEVRAIGGFNNVKSMEKNDGDDFDWPVSYLTDEMDDAFLGAVQSSCLDPELVRRLGSKMNIVYTALHGTGGTMIPRALALRGFNYVQVPEQAELDGEFPTVKSPNPEEGAALDMALALAKEEGMANVVIGTDPDADRVGIAVRSPKGEFVLFNGNQTAALLTWYICEQRKRAGTFPDNAAVVSTIVSGDMMKVIARSYGAEVVETLTGFKWIGQKITQWEELAARGEPGKTYLFGAEESYGYMPSTYTRDKDAVTSAAYIADLAAMMAAQGKDIYQLLHDLYRQYGYFQEFTKNLTLLGKEGADKIKSIMNRLRSQPPKEIAGLAISKMGDCLSGAIREMPSGQPVGRYDLPASDVIVFTLTDGSKVIARPSGTEPKIKFYILIREPADDLNQAIDCAQAKTSALSAAIDELAR